MPQLHHPVQDSQHIMQVTRHTSGVISRSVCSIITPCTNSLERRFATTTRFWFDRASSS